MKNGSLPFIAAFVLIISISSCDHIEKVASKAAVTDTTVKKTEEVKSYDIALVDNRKDPACGMPVTAGINDTAHYKGKVLGFCSAECKAEFKKDPEAGLLAAELKK